MDPEAGPLAAACLVLTSLKPSHIKMFRRKGCQVENQGHTYRCPQQHNICLLQGAWDAICPHVPSRFPVKHQGKDPKGEDGSSKAEGFPATLSPVAKYLLGQNQNEYKYWLSTINNKWTNWNFADETGVGTCRVWRSWRSWRKNRRTEWGVEKVEKDPWQKFFISCDFRLPRSCIPTGEIQFLQFQHLATLSQTLYYMIHHLA